MTAVTAEERPRLRVLTMNIWARHGDWPVRRTVLREAFRQLRPDLLALQESVVTDDYDQVRDLLGPDYSVVHQRRREADGTGMSLASRWPIRDTDEHELLVTDRVDPQEFMGALLSAVVEAPAPFPPLLFASPKPSFRLGPELERELQAVGAARRLVELAAPLGAHVVLGSDFDAVADSASMRFSTGRQSLAGMSVAYHDAWADCRSGDEGHTFSPRNPLVTRGNWPLETGRRIDYVLVGCDDNGPTLQIDTCRLVLDAPVDGVWASDHFGVLSELSLPRPDPGTGS
jgi:endonuclease/exonuclease/phosphatase family metal-dependent hydrolase